ncbi:MAG: glycosyltransferase family 9 protein [Clostridium sp.]|nr:glycosyltransferase family 9 protein [Clostridium sp.]
MGKSKYKKILIIREGAIGDVVHTTNIFRSLKNYDSDIQIDYVTSKVPSQLLVNDSRLRKVYVFESKDYSFLTKLGLELRKEKYDLVINLQSSLRFRYFCMLINGKETILYKKSYRFHAVENFYDTARQKIPELVNPKNLELEIPDFVLDKIKEEIPTDKKIVILNTQTSLTRHGRKWSFESFKQLAFDILERYNCYILIPGSKDDIDEVKCYEGLHPNIIVTAGKFNILESAALFSLANVFVSSDTGPLHIATAVKKPYCIGLYGAAAVGRTGPWGENHFAIAADLPCIPCGLRKCKLDGEKKNLLNPCMTAIKPEHVMRIIIDNDLL